MLNENFNLYFNFKFKYLSVCISNTFQRITLDDKLDKMINEIIEQIMDDRIDSSTP